MAELLLELFSEEIPARMQARAADDLRRLVTDALVERGITYAAAAAFATPRRLTLSLDGVLTRQPDRREEKRGPRANAPEAALAGFLRQFNLTPDQVKVAETDKGAFYTAVIETPGAATEQVLADILPGIIRTFPWPKSMRWGSGELRWVRPLQSILCCFNGEVVPFEIDGIASGDQTQGHRFLAPGTIHASKFEDYVDHLRKSFVILDPAERREIIAHQSAQIAFANHLSLVDDPGLLDEVAGLVEWPVVLLGSFDPVFLDVPPEVLTTTMRTNQKYFALRDAGGKLAPRFLVVSNLEAADGGAKIVAGNEKVLRARLSDARFFWEQDKRARLDSRIGALKNIVFHAKLGTLAERVERITQLTSGIAMIIGADPQLAARAAMLCKADLTTGMVGEFPELQGLMGRYYALADGEHADVADAICDHYSPLGPTDTVPTALVSIAVALAEKLDSLLGFFAIDEKPTGSKDPFALRRACLGMVRLILENNLRLNLTQVFQQALELHGAKAEMQAGLIAEVLSFVTERLKVFLRDRNKAHDLVGSVLSAGRLDDLVDIVNRIDALDQFLATADGINLLASQRRASNILRIEEKKDNGTSFIGATSQDLLVAEEENALNRILDEIEPNIEANLDAENYAGVMKLLSQLRAPLDAFFENVTVNAKEPEIRHNRLRLLNRIDTPLGKIADFSLIERK
jgi:glycyl-tRNA synthetase beta chain